MFLFYHPSFLLSDTTHTMLFHQYVPENMVSQTVPNLNKLYSPQTITKIKRLCKLIF